MNFVIQSDKRRNCGQVALSALTEQPLEFVTSLIGHAHGTRSKELVAALRALGYQCPDKCGPAWVMRTENAFGLAQRHDTGRSGWHWVAVGSGMVYDGHRTGPMPIEDYCRYIKAAHSGRLTSFLPVTK